MDAFHGSEMRFLTESPPSKPKIRRSWPQRMIAASSGEFLVRRGAEIKISDLKTGVLAQCGPDPGASARLLAPPRGVTPGAAPGT